MRSSKVKVVRESSTGLNIRVDINGTTYTNNQAYNRAEKGLVPGYHGVLRNGIKYIRSNPDGNKSNNSQLPGTEVLSPSAITRRDGILSNQSLRDSLG